MNDYSSYEEWLATRTKIVQELAERFPPGTIFLTKGTMMYVVSYYEDGGLGISSIDPFEDYEKSFDERQYICSDCLKDLEEITNYNQS